MSNHSLSFMSPLLLRAQLIKRMETLNDTCDRNKDKWQKKICKLESTLEKTKVRLYEEKARHRHQLTEEEIRQIKLEEEIHDLNAWILELDNERKTAEAEMQKVTKKFIHAKEESYSRLQNLHKETQARRAKEDESIRASKALCHSEKEL
jgi:hypothetical protein